MSSNFILSSKLFYRYLLGLCSTIIHLLAIEDFMLVIMAPKKSIYKLIIEKVTLKNKDLAFVKMRPGIFHHMTMAACVVAVMDFLSSFVPNSISMMSYRDKGKLLSPWHRSTIAVGEYVYRMNGKDQQKTYYSASGFDLCNLKVLKKYKVKISRFFDEHFPGAGFKTSAKNLDDPDGLFDINNNKHEKKSKDAERKLLLTLLSDIRNGIVNKGYFNLNFLR